MEKGLLENWEWRGECCDFLSAFVIYGVACENRATCVSPDGIPGEGRLWRIDCSAEPELNMPENKIAAS